MPYRRRYYWRRRRQTSPQEKADQTSRELYWQVRREISNESDKAEALRPSDLRNNLGDSFSRSCGITLLVCVLTRCISRLPPAQSSSAQYCASSVSCPVVCPAAAMTAVLTGVGIPCIIAK